MLYRQEQYVLSEVLGLWQKRHSRVLSRYSLAYKRFNGLLEASSSSGSVSYGYCSDFESEETHTAASPTAAVQISEAADAERSPDQEDEGSVSDIEDEQPQGPLPDLENTVPTTTTAAATVLGSV